MQKEWMSITELQTLTKIPETTIRRYLSLFPDVVPMRVSANGRAKRYGAVAVDVVAKIAELYREGLDTDTIGEQLVAEFGHNVEPGQELATIPPGLQDAFQQLAATMQGYQQELTDLRGELEQLRDSEYQRDQELEDLREANRQRDQEIAELKDAEKRREQEMASRDHQLTERMRQMMTEHQEQEKKKTLWQRLFR